MIRQGARYVDQSGCLTTEGYLALTRIDQMEASLAALAAKLDAAAAVADATGGSTVDAEARAELVAIKAALG